MYKSILIIEDDKRATLISEKKLEIHGIEKIISLKDQEEALIYLILNNPKQLLILIDLYAFINDDFEFIQLHNKIITDNSNKICLFSASFTLNQIKNAKELGVETVFKPLTEATISKLIRKMNKLQITPVSFCL